MQHNQSLQKTKYVLMVEDTAAAYLDVSPSTIYRKLQTWNEKVKEKEKER